MKKTSTAMAQPSRNISQQKLTIGLDLGDRIAGENCVNTTANVANGTFSGTAATIFAYDRSM